MAALRTELEVRGRMFQLFKSGVLLLKDKRCATPDGSALCWCAMPGWAEQPGLRVLALSEARLRAQGQRATAYYNRVLSGGGIRSIPASRHRDRREAETRCLLLDHFARGRFFWDWVPMSHFGCFR